VSRVPWAVIQLLLIQHLNRGRFRSWGDRSYVKMVGSGRDRSGRGGPKPVPTRSDSLLAEVAS